jgi:hypothetical protein
MLKERYCLLGAQDYTGVVAVGRNLITASMPSTTNIAMTIS